MELQNELQERIEKITSDMALLSPDSKEYSDYQSDLNIQVDLYEKERENNLNEAKLAESARQADLEHEATLKEVNASNRRSRLDFAGKIIMGGLAVGLTLLGYHKEETGTFLPQKFGRTSDKFIKF